MHFFSRVRDHDLFSNWIIEREEALMKLNVKSEDADLKIYVEILF